MGDQEDNISTCTLYCIMAAMMLFGTCNTIVMKAQDDMVNDDYCNSDQPYEEGNTPCPNGQSGTFYQAPKFTHPYFQCANMFLGELCCFIPYVIKRLCFSNKKKTEVEDDEGSNEIYPLSPGTQLAQERKLKTNINPLLFAIPAVCDFCGSTLMFVALTQCAASVYQMMRGVIVVITAGLAMAFLGRKQYIHHYIALLAIVAAVAIVGAVGILISNQNEDDDDGGATTKPLGIILLLISQVFTGCLFIVEEKLLSGYYLDPLYVVGWEGFWGCCIYAIVLPIFEQVKDCTNPLCQYGYLENSALALQQMKAQPIIILQSCGIIVSIACFNATGVAVTKYASAPQRSTIDTSRTLLIWIAAILMGSEKLVPLSAAEAGAFVLLVGGTLVYNEIVILPCSLLNYNTKEKQAERDQDGEALESVRDMNYIALSPGAAYDNTRNLRNIEKGSNKTKATDY